MYQNFALKNFGIAYFIAIGIITLSHYVGTWNFEVFCSILDKKDPPKDKQLPSPLGHYQSYTNCH